MSLLTLLIIVLVVFAIVGAPTGPLNHGYGWYPSGGIGLVLLVLLIVLLIR